MGTKKEKNYTDRFTGLIKILRKDKRHSFEAYAFVLSALDYTLQKLKRKGHVSGQELAYGIKDYCLEQFGPMSRTVLEHWGIKKTGDFGEIVFNMIEVGLLGKSEQDSKADFKDIYDFKEAFDEGWKIAINNK